MTRMTEKIRYATGKVVTTSTLSTENPLYTSIKADMEPKIF
jgi:hypothetical protein